MKLSLSRTDREDVAIMTVSGEVDVYTAPQLRSALEERVAEAQTRVVVDLQGVTFIDSTGLGVLVGRLKALRKVGGSLRVVCTDERILRLFGITGLDRVLPLHDSVDDALAAFGDDVADPGATA